jgi:uncharacterized repeat protein (TIGR01451 family)
MSDAIPHQPPAQSPRQSRQQLVVPPRQATWPVVLGAVASGMVGFGLVFGLGIGRSRHPAHDHGHGGRLTVAVSDSDAVKGVEPHVEGEADVIPVSAGHEARAAASAEPAAAERWAVPDSDFQATEFAAPPARFARPVGDVTEDRYAARIVSHESDHGTSEPPPRSSRFATPDLPPPDLAPAEVPVRASGPDLDASEPPAPDVVPAATPHEGAMEALSAADRNAVGMTDVGPVSQAAADTAASGSLPAATEPSPAVTERLAGSEPAHEEAVLNNQLAQADTSAEGPAASTQAIALAAEPVSTTPQDPVEPQLQAATAEPPVNPFVAAPPASPVVPPSADVDRAQGSPWSQPATVAAAASAAEVEAPPSPNPAALPFAAAPPLGPTPSGGGFAGPPAAGHADDQDPAMPGLTGQGVPGPLQLEGVQTPQLAVEKRGPKEIQVGKPARYEILVRNVGSATAHDVLLRDAVPRGTSLIATTPPAAPAAEREGAPGELVWTLGALPPGGEVRILMELMPEEEGDIGSIASVSFRADATLRSRSTKPALAIDCPEPDPVRIGRDMQVSLTISNPGSGTATGVVLEAFLPETVSHRAGGELEFDVGQLRPGETKTIDLVLGTRGPGLQPARLVARADAGIEEVLQVPLEVTAPTLELAIDMPARRFLQRPATCRIAIVNAGTASARAVEIAAQLPPGMKFVRANNAGWHDERTHRVLWNLEELPAGETGTVEAVVMPVQPGPQRITAAARSTDGPSAQVDHLCQVEGLAALSFQVMDSEDPIEVTGLTEYVIRVSNDGTKAASGVRVAATLLGDLEPVEATGPGGHRVENLAVEFEPLAKLGPGEEAVYRVRARGHRAGDQRVQVQLVSDDHPTPITKEEITSVYDDR